MGSTRSCTRRIPRLTRAISVESCSSAMWMKIAGMLYNGGCVGRCCWLASRTAVPMHPAVALGSAAWSDSMSTGSGPRQHCSSEPWPTSLRSRRTTAKVVAGRNSGGSSKRRRMYDQDRAVLAGPAERPEWLSCGGLSRPPCCCRVARPSPRWSSRCRHGAADDRGRSPDRRRARAPGRRRLDDRSAAHRRRRFGDLHDPHTRRIPLLGPAHGLRLVGLGIDAARRPAPSRSSCACARRRSRSRASAWRRRAAARESGHCSCGRSVYSDGSEHDDQPEHDDPARAAIAASLDPHLIRHPSPPFDWSSAGAPARPARDRPGDIVAVVFGVIGRRPRTVARRGQHRRTESDPASAPSRHGIAPNTGPASDACPRHTNPDDMDLIRRR